jgi:hypothetical protein
MGQNARPKSSSRIESKRPSAAASWAIAFHVANQRPQRDLLLDTGLIWSAQRSFRVPRKCTTETRFDAQQLLPSSLVSAVLLWCMGAMIHLENDDS